MDDGTYNENVQIVKENVSLTSINRGAVVINPADPNRPVINVTADGVSIRGFNITSGNDYGILVNANRCTVSYNYLKAGGIKLNGSSNSTIRSNTITSDSMGFDGITLVSSSGNLISRNIITRRANGIWLGDSSYNTISQNRFEENTYSIAMNGAAFNSIIDNNMTDNNFGIYNYGVNNTITANRIANSLCYNLQLTGSDNSIYGNYLINGLVYTEAGNRLNNTEIGNYWSHYSGNDTNGDGLGDSPISVDYRPLIVDLAVINATVTPTNIQVIIRNNGQANLTRIDPTGQFMVKINCDGNETAHYINALNYGETQTITRPVGLGPGSHVVNITIPYNETTQLLEGKNNIRDACIINNNLTVNRNLIPATINYGNLTATPLKGTEPLNVTVTVKITNTGDFSKNETVLLVVNGTIVDQKTVEVDGQSTVTVTFTILLQNGTHTVTVNNMTPVNVTVFKPLSVLSVDPANGALSVSSTKRIVITFSENILAGSAYGNITVRTSSGVSKKIEKSTSGNRLYIKPVGSWSPGVRYIITVPRNSVKTVNGVTLASDFSSSFTSAIAVTYIDPRNGATGVSRTRTIVITFSNSIIAGPAYSKITVKTSTGRLKSISKRISGNRLYIKPVGSWSARTKYIITVPWAAVKTSTGNMMAADFRSAFTTA
ncbi:Ig-like domain-containing protein [Methanothermobacter sp. K4]|uniref:Ig-like domain-containing protein n=1 Tax=Methanothermobacter sp. K4 TaxID=2913262 RepID=UPI001EDC175E|nr:Ig-like domain-containing protein [Methanothermobacter sp. K4]